MKLRKGNVFTSVCQEFCSQGGVHLRDKHPSGQTPPSRHPLWADTLLSRHPIGRHPPPTGQTHPMGRKPCKDSHCSGWYTSYWNAFLFKQFTLMCFVAVPCRAFSLPNRTVHYSRPELSNSLSRRYPIDTVASFSCNSGYSRSGPSSSTCQSIHGGWSRGRATCNKSYETLRANGKIFICSFYFLFIQAYQ